MTRTAIATATAIVAAAFATATVADASSHSKHVSKTNVHPWPLTVKSGTVICRNGGAIVFHHGGDYAVNGTALTEFPHMAKINRIWKKQPGTGGLRVDIGGLIDAGLALC